MTVKGRGNQWQKRGFSVFLNTDGETGPHKCLRCKADKEKCLVCFGYSEFEDRGYYLIEKRAK